MKCCACKKESPWMEIIGADFVCTKCVHKHPIMKLIHGRHIDTFRGVLKKLDIKNYDSYLKITRSQIEDVVDFEKLGIRLKTTNVVELE